MLFVIGAFFTLLMMGPADPFLHNAAIVHQGAGPNALLQDNPLVAVHPPLLYIGFVGFSVPFAFAIAMLITGRVHERWPLEQRRWTVLAWGSLSLGIILGAWWSYQVLGWGGFWGWDPVENAALLPWLTATAYIHSVIVQDRRGLFRVWNLSLYLPDEREVVVDRVGGARHDREDPVREGVRDSDQVIVPACFGPLAAASGTAPIPPGTVTDPGVVVVVEL